MQKQAPEGPGPTWGDPALEAALQRCRAAYVGPGACFLPAYLRARYEYHRLLVSRGLLNPLAAEGTPK